jgi:hypothetical protein
VHLSTPDQGLYLLVPPYLQSDVWSLAGAGDVQPKPSRIRMEIVPLTAGSAHWGFVSITNNAKQQLTLVTPQ